MLQSFPIAPAYATFFIIPGEFFLYLPAIYQNEKTIISD
jgi:hypothetical protein